MNTIAGKILEIHITANRHMQAVTQLDRMVASNRHLLLSLLSYCVLM